jgi:cytochrome P450
VGNEKKEQDGMSENKDRAPSFTDPETLKCPYEAYKYLLAEKPVYHDETSGLHILSRYQDVRDMLRSPLLSTANVTEKLRQTVAPARANRIEQLFEEKGWARERNLPNYEGNEHKEIRDIFEQFLRAGKIKEHDEWIRDWCYTVVDEFVAQGKCEVLSQFAEKISIGVLCHLVDADLDKIPLMRASMHAIEAGLSFTQNEDAEIANAEIEIEAQHYFMGLIREKRENPDGGFLSAIVNTALPSGRKLSDRQLLTQIQFDLFMAGADTTTKAMASGVAMMIENPEVYARLQADPDKYLRTFVEEVLRLEPPASGTFRTTVEDVTLHGTTIPAGAVVTPRVAAANLDERHFACPAKLDLDRSNAATHMTFGSGVHACIGAPLARRELYWGFKALLDRVTDIRLAEGEVVEYVPSLVFRSLAHLNVTFTPRV